MQKLFLKLGKKKKRAHEKRFALNLFLSSLSRNYFLLTGKTETDVVSRLLRRGPIFKSDQNTIAFNCI